MGMKIPKKCNFFFLSTLSSNKEVIQIIQQMAQM